MTDFQATLLSIMVTVGFICSFFAGYFFARKSYFKELHNIINDEYFARMEFIKQVKDIYENNEYLIRRN